MPRRIGLLLFLTSITGCATASTSLLADARHALTESDIATYEIDGLLALRYAETPPQDQIVWNHLVETLLIAHMGIHIVGAQLDATPSEPDLRQIMGCAEAGVATLLRELQDLEIRLPLRIQGRLTTLEPFYTGTCTEQLVQDTDNLPHISEVLAAQESP